MSSKIRRIDLWSIVLLAALVIIMVASAMAVGSAYEGKPGRSVTSGGVLVAGLDRKAYDSKIKKAFNTASIRLDGVDDDVRLADLGVSINYDKSWKAAVNGKNRLTRGIRLFTDDEPLSWSLDKRKMNAKLVDLLVPADQRVVEPSTRFNDSTGHFEVIAGKTGKTPDSSTVETTIRKTMSSLTNTNKPTAKVKLVNSKPTVSTSEASKVLQYMDKNASITRTITINGVGELPVDASMIAPAISFTRSGGIVKARIDPGKLRDSIVTEINAKYGKQMVPQITMMTPDGKTRVNDLQYGHDGKAVDADSIDARMLAFRILEGVGWNGTAIMKTVPMEHQYKNAPGNFGVANGDPWLKVDLSAQKAYAYKGTTLVNSFDVATGKPGHRTYTGVYYVNVKYSTQTMRGEDYVTPNVRWISYFNGGEGFHAAPWNLGNISAGIPSSHGCVNMRPADAKWVYDFAPIGTKVEVVGSSPARAR